MVQRIELFYLHLKGWGRTAMNQTYLSRYKTLGLNIAYFRKKKGLTQEELAEKAEVDRSTISKTEIAFAGTSLDVLFKIADVLEIEPYKLLIERD